MGPCIDVYVMSRRRDAEMIRSFLDDYTKSGDPALAGRTVEIVPLGTSGQSLDADRANWEEVGVGSIDALVDLAVSKPFRSFIMYLDAVDPWCSALMSTTETGEIVFGVAVDDPLDEPEPRAVAKRLLAELRSYTSATHGWINWEMPPPFHPRYESPWSNDDAFVSFQPLGSDESGEWRIWTEAGGLIWIDPGDEQKALRAALSDCVSTLSPLGEDPGLSTYWVDQVLDRLEADEPELAHGNLWVLTLSGQSVEIRMDVDDDTSDPIATVERPILIRGLSALRSEVQSRFAAGYVLDDRSWSQKNPHTS